MGVHDDRRATAAERRRRVIEVFDRQFNLKDERSAVRRFGALLDEPRVIVANADIDGLVSSMMLASVSQWRVGAIIDKRGYLHHPHRSPFLNPDSLATTAVGVDVFSLRFPSAANHPVLYGGDVSRAQAAPLRRHDERVAAASVDLPMVNPSLWVGTEARLGSAHALGMPYKYPFGTAQVLLAVLEAVGRPPRFFDRQFLPWLVANCDGGVDTIRTYAWNAEVWWSALAAVVGPSSQSEALYRLATTQRPNEFVDADHRLRYEYPETSPNLNGKWNLRNTTPGALAAVTSLITDLSGWPDPFLDGVSSLSTWQSVEPHRAVLPVSGLTKINAQDLEALLVEASSAIHLNFSVFKERGTALGWMLLDPAASSLIQGDVPIEESDVGDPEGVPDADALD